MWWNGFWVKPRPTVTPALQEAFEKLEEQMTWRGPNGKCLGHLVLDRRLGEAVHEFLGKSLTTDGGPFEDEPPPPPDTNGIT